ncbi:MAG: GNAT family N-acetyltransferase [Byssovorax sp.]
MPREVIALHDKPAIEAFLRRDPALHLYALGDLDDFFFPHTSFHALREDGALRALFLVYRGLPPPVLLALEEHDPEAAEALLPAVVATLPRPFYVHVSPALRAPMERLVALDDHGRHLKMILSDREKLAALPPSPIPIRPLTEADLPAILDLYRRAYEGNWFDPRMLGTGQFCGAFLDGALAAIAGVHVCSERYRVAALGNIATDPRRRGEGLGTAVTAALCRRLFERVDHVGLNVKADNEAALRCYARVGFTVRAAYDEAMTREQRSSR